MALKSLLFSVFFFAATVYAEVDPSAIYMVDMERVFTESIAGKAVKNTIESQVKKKQGKFEVLETDLRALQADFQKQSSLLSPEALAAKREEVIRKEKELSRAMQDEREALARANDAELSTVLKEVDAIIKELAEKDGYRLIIERDKRYVFYVKEEYDLTGKVISILDQRKIDL